MKNLYLSDQMLRVIHERASCEEMMTVIDTVANDETGNLRKIFKNLLIERLEDMSKNPISANCPELMALKKDYCSKLLAATRTKKTKASNQ